MSRSRPQRAPRTAPDPPAPDKATHETQTRWKDRAVARRLRTRLDGMAKARPVEHEEEPEQRARYRHPVRRPGHRSCTRREWHTWPPAPGRAELLAGFCGGGAREHLRQG